jgi:hypothetical protein
MSKSGFSRRIVEFNAHQLWNHQRSHQRLTPGLSNPSRSTTPQPLPCRSTLGNPNGCQNLPSRCQLIPRRCQLIPKCCQSIPRRCQPIPSRCQSIPRRCQLIPSRCQLIPSRCQSIPRRCQPIPRSCQLIPKSCQRLPKSCKPQTRRSQPLPPVIAKPDRPTTGRIGKSDGLRMDRPHRLLTPLLLKRQVRCRR